MNPLDSACADHAAAARLSDKPVIGYLANTVPVEMIRAAGFFALQLVGNPRHATPRALERMEDFFDGYILSIFDRMLAGEYSWLDAVIVPRSSEVLLQLYYHMLEVRRAEPQIPMPRPILFDILHSPGPATARYNAGRLAALRDRLSDMGTPVTDAALAAEIATANRVRAALDRLDSLRRESPARLRGSTMLRATIASTLMPPDAFTAAAQALAAEPETAPAGPRLLLTGSPHDEDGFHKLVEATGANIVADDHGTGAWWFDHPVDESGDAMQALLHKYHLNAPSPRSYPRAVTDGRLMHAVDRARPDAVIFFTDEWDDTFGFDYPTQRDLLAARGIPTLFLKEQSYRKPDRAAQEAALRDLYARIGQGAQA